MDPNSRSKKEQQRGLDIIITGIPRSGTSYLCGLLDKADNNVVINEPNGMSRYLGKQGTPDVLAKYYKKIRKAILSGEEIENKLSNGKIIEDTALYQKLELYYPQFVDETFSLCTKNTLGYLARLDKIKRVMPDSLIFACIRNPLDTIASWKTTFDHLKTAIVADDYIIGSKNDRFLSAWQQKQVQIIANENNLARRRAYLWAYLAKWIWRNKDILTIVKYDDIVLSPQSVIEAILSKGAGERGVVLTESVKPSNIRTGKRRFLSSSDCEAIEELCYPIARKMGVVFDS